MKIKEELKTLKDLDKEYIEEKECNDPQTAKEFEWVKVEELKSEAVKWANSNNYISENYKNGKVDFIMDFFNITEQDLKEQEEK